MTGVLDATVDAAPTSPYAGLASRSTALAIDVALITVAALSISVLPSLAWAQVLGDSPGWLGTASGILAAVLPWVYFTFCWWSSGQTAGGLLIGIAVERSGGQRVSLLQAALRSAIGLLIAPLWLIGYVGILLDKNRRAWHDVVFRTVVRHRVRDELLDQPLLESRR